MQSEKSAGTGTGTADISTIPTDQLFEDLRASIDDFESCMELVDSGIDELGDQELRTRARVNLSICVRIVAEFLIRSDTTYGTFYKDNPAHYFETREEAVEVYTVWLEKAKKVLVDMVAD